MSSPLKHMAAIAVWLAVLCCPQFTEAQCLCGVGSGTDHTPPTLTGVPANLTVSCSYTSNFNSNTVTTGGNCNGSFRTQTQGAWGAACNGNNSGCYRNTHFASAFPSGLVIGCSGGFTLTLTSAAAVETFEPCGGTSGPLTVTSIDPACNTNVLAGQLVAATLSVVFDANDPNFSSSTTQLGSLIMNSGPLAGLTVNQILTEANNAIGGCGSAYSYAALTAALDAFNNNYDNGTQNLGNFSCPGGTVTCGGVSATDNCDALPDLVCSETVIPGNCPNSYMIVHTWTATDNCGNVTTATQTITVVDDIAPVLAGVPADATASCDAVPAAAAVTATDNCGGAPVVTLSETTTAGNCPSNYVIHRTWTATDACGNSSSATQNIAVSDLTAPVLVGVPADAAASCNSVPAAPVVSATDNCGSATVTLGTTTTPGNCASSYTLVRTWTATDACGNTASASQTVTVSDNQGPVLVGVPADITLSCPYTSDFNTGGGNNGSSCSGEFRTQTQGAWGAACNGNNSACYRNANFAAAFPNGLTVGCNNTLTLTSAQAVENFEPCGGTAGALTQSYVNPPCVTNVLAGQLVAAVLNVGFDAYDANFSNSTATLGSLTLTSGPLAGLTVNQVLAEANNALGGCGSAYSFSDLTAALDAINTNFDNGSQDLGNLDCPGSNVCAGVTATDNCDANPVVTCTETTVAGNCPGNYTIVHTWTATDACGNVTTATQTITVVDNVAPVLVGVPGDINAVCGSIPSPANVTATDACGSATVTMTETTTGSGCNQTVVRTWTATDACGNTASASQTITISDNVAPVIVGVPASSNAVCGSIPAAANVTAADNCDANPVVTMTETTTGSGCNQTVVRTWTATDACGNTASASQTITISDNVAPVLVGVPASSNTPCGTIPAAANVTATDNCDANPVVTMSQTTTGSGCNQTVVRTWTATDACGNTASASQTITISDNVAPVLVGVPASSNTPCGTIPVAANVTATDNCDANPVVTMSQTTTGSGCNQTVVRTWTATDACGNTASASQTITISDNTAPVLVGVPANATAQCNAPAPANVTATDNCTANPTVTMTSTTSGTACNQVVVRTWTATDACGNTASASQTITIIDNTAPVLVGVPANATAQCNNVPAAATVTATDNCSAAPVVTLSTQTLAGNCANNYTIRRTWTATDACGNTATAMQTITVVDNTAPTAVCRNITVQATGNGTVTVTGTDINNGSSDNCSAAGNLTLTLSNTSVSCGTSTVILTVADQCGNSSTCSATVTVSGACDVEFTSCPNNITAACTNVCSGTACTGHGCTGSHSGYCSRNVCGGHECHGAHSGVCSGHECHGNGCSGGHSGFCSSNVCSGQSCSGNHNGYCTGNSCSGHGCHGHHGGYCSASVCTGSTCSGGHGGYCSHSTCSGYGCNGSHSGYCSRNACGGTQCDGHHGGRCSRVNCSGYGCSGNHSGYCSRTVCGGSTYCNGTHSGYCSRNNCQGRECEGGHSGYCSRTVCAGSSCGGSHSGFCSGRGCQGHGCNVSHYGYCSRNACSGNSCNGRHGGRCSSGSSSNGCSGGYSSGACGGSTTSCNGHIGGGSCSTSGGGSSCQQGAIVTWVAPTATAVNACATNTCPTNTTICGFTYLGENGGHRYYVSTGTSSWTAARSLAMSNGGYLASVDNASENSYLVGVLGSYDAWIGANDVYSEGNYAWTGGGNCSFYNWGSGEPNNQTPSGCCGDADYVAMNGDNGSWFDRGNCENYRCVMEMNCSTNACAVTVTQVGGPASGSFFAAGTTTTITYVATTTGGDRDTCRFTVGVGNCPVNYCASNGSCSGYEWIRNVAVSNLNNTSGSNGGYANYTQYAANVTPGVSYPLTLRAGYASTIYTENWKVWVDWNRDGDFTDANETVFSGAGAGTVYGNLAVPANATNGSTRMRVSMQYGCNTTGACGSFSYGEVEDYTITVSTGARMATGTNGQPEGSAEAEANAPAERILHDGIELVNLYPNPVRDNATLSFTSLRAGNIKIEVMTVDGKLVKSLVGIANERDNAYDLRVDDLSAGTYLVKLSMGDYSATEKFVKQ